MKSMAKAITIFMNRPTPTSFQKFSENDTPTLSHILEYMCHNINIKIKVPKPKSGIIKSRAAHKACFLIVLKTSFSNILSANLLAIYPSNIGYHSAYKPQKSAVILLYKKRMELHLRPSSHWLWNNLE